MQKAGKLIRYPGGYWAAEHWERWITPWYGTSTIEALVIRGLAIYTEWKQGRPNKFPVAMELTKAGWSMSKENNWTYEEMGV
jgi:hypothetical protein